MRDTDALAPRREREPVRVLLTGASGFLGSRTIELLTARGYEIHAVSGHARRHPDVIWHRADLLDGEATASVVRAASADRLLHFAWYAKHGEFWSAPVNLEWVAATLLLVRAFREAGGRRAVLAGSCAEYDWSDPQDRCRELTDGRRVRAIERSSTLYGAAKHATRLAVAAYAAETGLSLAWGRIFLLYGPGEDPRRLVPSVTRALIEEREATTTDGVQIRDVMHVDDAARAFVTLLDSEVEGPVNVASGAPVSLRRVIETIGACAGRPDLLRIGALPPRAQEPARLVADTTRLHSEVGFKPQIGLEQGIARTVAWWRARLADGRQR